MHIEEFIRVVAEFLERTFPRQENVTRRQRQKVQTVPGEILTSDESLARLQLAQQEREAAKQAGRYLLLNKFFNFTIK